jgi:hypothetical protein
LNLLILEALGVAQKLSHLDAAIADMRIATLKKVEEAVRYSYFCCLGCINPNYALEIYKLAQIV